MGHRPDTYDRAVAEDDLDRAVKAHPDIWDSHGRKWRWRVGSRNLYVHCKMAIPREWIATVGLMTQAALDNPNYDPCEICLDGRERNV